MEFLNKINLVGNEIADRIAKVPKNLQQDNSETVTIENHKEIPKERHLSPVERQEIIDELR